MALLLSIHIGSVKCVVIRLKLNSNLVLILQQSKNHTDIKDNNVATPESEVVHILMSAADFTYWPVSIKIDKSEF